ncbi:GDP-mannose-dependent alpha-(1-2)-phosphatidylinositol mannosyltransferase [Pseudobythopirellula maris]|uniref:GDP-mannose-dependent alpha-(1-2)-phosphatidylinositol mannosyltransferase n=1 Tax=Pseudobythopirellula maris TaxID=2527991 RepID=A0A5C5ZNJ1_9BACT|nr:glycosyltransferase family 4 protein [Pseudobythopirellula maris]TWT88686.1 GDP-mannose-dependent alpha-(1-2)-phosphatidylinositol mannosyltransferase [Pseudobythopirellula maris]
MRILTICRDLGRGGTQRVAQTLSLEYHKAGHETGLLAIDAGGVREKALHEAGLPVFVGGENAALEAALGQADRFGPDVIHIHRPGMANAKEGAVMRRLKTANRRVVETSHFGRADHSLDGELIDAHLQISRWCLWRWRRWGGRALRNKPAAVAPNPVDVERFRRAPAEQIAAFRRDELGLPENAFLCGRIGQALPGKWSPALLESFGALLEECPEARLLVIGMPETARQELAAAPAKIRERFIEHPLVDSDERLSLLYSSFDVFLHAATIGETFGLVLAEAMLCGCPPLTMNTPPRDNSQSEIVQHGEAGLVALSAGDLPQALLEAYRDDALRTRLAARGRESIVERFESSRVAALILRALTHAVDSTDRADLARRFEGDPDLTTRIPNAEVRRTLRNGIGSPAALDLLKLRLVTQPTLYRLLRAVRG